MNVQYIKDDKGGNAGVFIPIEEWEELLERLKKVESIDASVEEWQKSVVNERMSQYHKNPSKTYDAEKTLRELEDEL
jgi:hypothetical protein